MEYAKIYICKHQWKSIKTIFIIKNSGYKSQDLRFLTRNCSMKFVEPITSKKPRTQQVNFRFPSY